MESYYINRLLQPYDTLYHNENTLYVFISLNNIYSLIFCLTNVKDNFLFYRSNRYFLYYKYVVCLESPTEAEIIFGHVFFPGWKYIHHVPTNIYLPHNALYNGKSYFRRDDQSPNRLNEIVLERYACRGVGYVINISMLCLNSVYLSWYYVRHLFFFQMRLNRQKLQNSCFISMLGR